MEPHEFWQAMEPADTRVREPFIDRYPARLPDERVLFLPIRALGDSGEGIASLIVNQSSFAVEAALADALAEALREARPEVIVGLPTLGLSLARGVAERLGHSRYVALGTSRKFWYETGLSVPLASITSPDGSKQLYLDPRLLPILEGRRIALVDDVISTGASIAAGLDLLARVGVTPVAIGAAMLQTGRWLGRLEGRSPPVAGQVCGVLRTPLLKRGDDGWKVAE